MPEINIRIYPDGKVQAEVNGVKGKSCTKYIKILEELLEAETIDSDTTPEYEENVRERIPVSETQEIRN